MTVDAILAEWTPRATRIALMEGRRLCELHIDRPERGAREGDILTGRVTRVSDGLDACFVALPGGLCGLLEARHADPGGRGGPISRLVHEGQALTVTVRREAREGKGPTLALRGRERAEARPGVGLLSRLTARHPAASVVVDHAAALATARSAGGGKAELHRGAGLFEEREVEDQIDAALGARLRLRCGATLLFEPTRTLTAVDVDSAAAGAAGRDPLAINLEAASAVARQLRLRNIGGLVVVDFLNMKGRVAGRRLMRALAQALRHDPCETASEGPTRFGTVEVARRRRGPSLAEALGAAPVAAAERLLRRLKAEAAAAPGKALRVRASPQVAGAVRGGDEGRAIGDWLGRAVELVAEPALAHDAFDIGVGP